MWETMVHRRSDQVTCCRRLLATPGGLVEKKDAVDSRGIMRLSTAFRRRWCMVHLGGLAVNFPMNKGSSASRVEGVAVARTVYQAHCYVLKIDAAVLAYIRAKMVDGGLLVDNAFVSWQRSLFKKRQYRAFWLNGPQLVQQGNFGSDILRATPELGGAAG